MSTGITAAQYTQSGAAPEVGLYYGAGPSGSQPVTGITAAWFP